MCTNVHLIPRDPKRLVGFIVRTYATHGLRTSVRGFGLVTQGPTEMKEEQVDDREREVRRRMDGQELYHDVGPGLEELEEARVRGKELAREFNALAPRDLANRQRVLDEMFAEIGEGTWVEPPLYVAYGAHTRIGGNVYVNTGLTVVDDSQVTIGDRVMFGPHVTIATAGHPIHPDPRATDGQFSAPVVIEDDAWIGANVTILPGVSIGRGSVVAAGAVVGAHVPPMTVVAGVPAKVIRAITDQDREWNYRPPRTLDI